MDLNTGAHIGRLEIIRDFPLNVIFCIPRYVFEPDLKA